MKIIFLFVDLLLVQQFQYWNRSHTRRWCALHSLGQFSSLLSLLCSGQDPLLQLLPVRDQQWWPVPLAGHRLLHPSLCLWSQDCGGCQWPQFWYWGQGGIWETIHTWNQGSGLHNKHCLWHLHWAWKCKSSVHYWMFRAHWRQICYSSNYQKVLHIVRIWH